MSQDEFKMMEDDDDDDIPDLESVASSEVSTINYVIFYNETWIFLFQYLDSDEDDLQYDIAEENEVRSPNCQSENMSI